MENEEKDLECKVFNDNTKKKINTSISKLNKLVYLSSMVVLASVGIFLFYILYCITFPRVIAKFEDPQFPVLNKDKIVSQGDVLLLKIVVTKYVDIPARILRRYVNNTVIRIPDTISSIALGKNEFISSMNIIPHALPPGKYYLEVEYIFEVNPFRTDRIIRRTEPFEVIPSDQQFYLMKNSSLCK
jgi:hypothetical protein